MITLRTARLVLRPVAVEDRERLHEFINQPGVRRYLFDDRTSPPERAREMIDASRTSFDQNGFGLWLGCRGDRLIGFSAIWFLRESRDRELLYAVHDALVGRGYGRELAQAVIDYAFQTLGWHEIQASTDTPNTASRRLLGKLGFRLTRRATVDGLDTSFYALRAQDDARDAAR